MYRLLLCSSPVVLKGPVQQRYWKGKQTEQLANMPEVKTVNESIILQFWSFFLDVDPLLYALVLQ